MRLFADMDGLIFAGVSVFYGHKYIIVVFFTDIVFIDKGKGVCLWQRTRKILSPFAK